MSDTEETMTLDRKAVVERLLAVIDAHPDNRNPVGGGGRCLYTDPVDPSRHCIVGQLAVDLGWPLPNGNPDAIEAAEQWPVLESGRTVLSKAQGLADNRKDSGTADPRRWGDIREDIAAMAEVSG